MPRATELMKVVPTLVVPAAYVGLLNTSGGLVARRYDENGGTLSDIGPFAGSVSASGGVAFIRGATEGSLAGCAAAFYSGGDLFVLDLEGEQLVTVATTHRPAEAGGFLNAVMLKAGASSFLECGLLGKSGGVLPAEAGSYVMWLRSIGLDGTTIASVASQSGHPLSGVATDEIQSGAPLLIGASTWAATFSEGDEEGSAANFSVATKTLTDGGSFVVVADRYDDNGTIAAPGPGPISPLPSVGLALAGDPVLMTDPAAAFQISRIILDTGGPFFYGGTPPADSRYVAEALLNLAGGFTVQNVGPRRTAGQLVVRVTEGSDDDVQASRLCTYAGTHPVTESTAGPNFQRDDAAGESLAVAFGL